MSNSMQARNEPSPSEGDGYENIEPWFEKLAALDADDPHRAVVREEILHRCLPLAHNIARRFTNRGVEFEDLLQIARLGLVHAVDRFDLEHGDSFLGFAVPTIMGEVRRYFRDHGWAVRVPRRMKELHQLLGPATDRLTHQLGRQPTARELASELGVELTEVTQALVARNAFTTESLDGGERTGEEGGALPIADRLGAVEPCYGLLEDAMAVRPLIAALPERERQVLILRFYDNKTQAEIGRLLGCSQMQVSRILAKTLTMLREKALAEPVPAS
ncbi:SigB/SigF/SigG family RNA polymerase sigma factor [Nocardia farcinica]|uniref:Putative sigma factor n=1 Tax=Nocardia farcinica (strain IFM 10152) TaxID=247156 RepID=Q5YYK9_NOCFA|nr:SigB/SigF/SigG family RNA polymerase sigma factor [Nocardia farcinica]MBF6234184.1 SigB/SigF/SigG family RNA polymerase sigma factor [Nocardia farcinica]BAD56732.1 putative sigma factor [Nocardia farcinica IFM 10152]